MYQNEQNFFTLYKEGLETDRPLFDEVLGAIAEVLSRYNTTVFENRFIVDSRQSQYFQDEGEHVPETTIGSHFANLPLQSVRVVHQRADHHFA